MEKHFTCSWCTTDTFRNGQSAWKKKIMTLRLLEISRSFFMGKYFKFSSRELLCLWIFNW